jgi:uncharacterized membrane protein
MPMNKSVTGIFPDRSAADDVVLALVAAGFRREQVDVVGADDIGRRGWIAMRVADTGRAVLLGAVMGGLGGAITGFLFGIGVGGVLIASAVGCGVIAIGGALLGTLVGNATTSQIREELQNEVDAGRVLVSVTTDDAHAPLLASILERAGRAVLSSRASFRAAILAGQQRT